MYRRLRAGGQRAGEDEGAGAAQEHGVSAVSEAGIACTRATGCSHSQAPQPAQRGWSMACHHCIAITICTHRLRRRSRLQGPNSHWDGERCLSRCFEKVHAVALGPQQRPTLAADTSAVLGLQQGGPDAPLRTGSVPLGAVQAQAGIAPTPCTPPAAHLSHSRR